MAKTNHRNAPEAPDRTPGSNVVPYDVFLRARENDLRSPGPAAPPGPRTISETARGEGPSEADLDAALRIVRSEVQDLPDTRSEKVRIARQRIRDGFYARPEVLDVIARRLLAGDAPAEI